MEEIIVANLTLDTYQRNKVAPLVVPQGDYGARVIRAKITDLGKPVTVESMAAVSIVATRSGDGESQAFSGSVNADGTVTVPVTQWMLDVPEEDVTCHIVVTGIGYQYSTTSFLIEPQEKANPTEISADDPRVDVVTEVLAGENTRRAAEAERVSNENARIAAENARQSAEEQRVTDESTRITNEAQRVSAEASRDAMFRSWAQDIASLPTFDGRINANRKRIENLESGIPAESFIIDDSVAYTKDVPENVAPNAVVQKVGGMTRKCTNLIPYPYEDSSKTLNGITCTVNGDGSIHVKGTCTAQSDFLVQYNTPLTLPAGTYVISGSSDSIGALYAYIEGIGTVYSTGDGTSFTLTKETPVRIAISVYEGNTVDKTIYPMLNPGDTAQPYEPYFEGLRSAKVTEVKSVGVNLLNPAEIRNGYYDVLNNGVFVESVGDQWKASGKMACFPSTYYTLSNIDLTSGYWQFFDSNDNLISYTPLNQSLLSVQTPANCVKLSFYCNFTGDAMVNKGSTALPYTPYVEHTLPIPEEARPANGINENVYDFIEWAEDGSVKKTVKCGIVDLGTLTWKYISSGNTRFDSYSLREVLKKNSNSSVANIICTKYEKVGTADQVYSGLAQIATTGGVIWICDTNYTDASSFKAAMQGVMLVYELAEPIITDISNLITADNLVPVQSGGTMTPVNEYGYAVPSTIIYQSR